MILIISIICMAQQGRAAPDQYEAPNKDSKQQSSILSSLAWKQTSKLIEERKYQEAESKFDAIRKRAMAEKDEPAWAHALIHQAQLKARLQASEIAVQFLKEQQWPTGTKWQAALQLYYTYALTNYLKAYRWEISQREKTVSQNKIELKAWTQEQILAEVLTSYSKIWSAREYLGGISIEQFEFLTPNTYPREIRGTLRDAVSYMIVETLVDTSLWAPKEQNDLYEQNLTLLLDPPIPQTKNILTVEAKDLHPIQRASFVLKDLEQWHTSRGEKEAGLEAYLTRARILRGSFNKEEEKALLRRHLEQTLPAYRSFPWWSMGQAALASMYETDLNHLVAAYQIAEEGYQAFPQSLGGKACLSLMGLIKQPQFSLSTMRNDGIGKRSIELLYKNMERVYFRAYEIDPRKYLDDEDEEEEGLIGEYTIANDKILNLLRKKKPISAWSETLPNPGDYKRHRFYVTPKLQKKGAYIVVASATSDFSGQNNYMEAATLLLSDIVLVQQSLEENNEIRALDAMTGEPLQGIEITVYQRRYNSSPEKFYQGRTDKEGLLKVNKVKEFYGLFVVAHHLDNWAIDPMIGERRNTERPFSAAMIYTDRSTYRPEQKIYFKIVAYHKKQSTAKPTLFTHKPAIIRLLDSNAQEVARQNVSTNEFGSAVGEFIIPRGKLLGAWQISSSIPGSHTIQVEEYKRPTFELTFRESKDPMRLNKTVTLFGEARYYFGLPVTQGKVSWNVTRTPIYPWWEYRYQEHVQTQIIATGTTSLKEDGSFLVPFLAKADEREDKNVSYSYQISADLTDEGGETRTISKIIQLGFVDVEANITMEPGFFELGQEGILEVYRSNLNGTPLAGQGRFWVNALNSPSSVHLPSEEPYSEDSINDPYFKALPSDFMSPRETTEYQPERTIGKWTEGEEIFKGTITHNEQGRAKVKLPRLGKGAYRFYYETKDGYGQVRKVWKNFIVVDPTYPLPLPAQFLLQKDTLMVGEKARVLVATGFKNQPVYLEVFRGSKRMSRKYLTEKEQGIIEIPITEADRGGFWIAFSTLRDHQWIQIRKVLNVPWTNKLLNIEFLTFRDKLKPGEKEAWQIRIKDHKGTPASVQAAEVLAYMYDKSLDLFGPHSVPSVQSLFPAGTSIPWWQTTKTSLGRSDGQIVYWEGGTWVEVPSGPTLTQDQLVLLEGIGIGGLGTYTINPVGAPPPSPVSMKFSSQDGIISKDKAGKNKLEEEKQSNPITVGGSQPSTESPLRENFSETAFFKPQLLTDKNGTVTIEFTAPDSVTAWNLWIHAMTKDLSSGSVKKEVKTVKELMVRPYIPRFLREGDLAEFQVMVNNAGDKELKGTLDIEFVDPETQKNVNALFQINKTQSKDRIFQVAPGKSKTFSFSVVAPKQVGLFTVKVQAKTGTVSDGELRPLPILPSRMHLTQSRFVTLRNIDKRTMVFEDLKKQDDPSRMNEQLVVTVDAQLLVTILKAVPYLSYYPYECSEQTLNRFLSAGILSSIFQTNPSLAKMGKDFSKRRRPYASFDEVDANRKALMEETPWLMEAKGGDENETQWIHLLDPSIAKAHRDQALQKLKKMQREDGGFPWFPGGPSSPYMTLYLMYGFAKATEFGIEIPKEMVTNGWKYLSFYINEKHLDKLSSLDDNLGFLILLNYAATSYPDPSWIGDVLPLSQRKQMLNTSFKHWKDQSPYLKSLLALTLHRMGRPSDAKLVFASVMDSAKTSADQGTFWQPEERSWLWYNDTIESHAHALRVLMEIEPNHPKKDGLVLWLMLNKKLNQWKSTRATAEVIYALVHYMKKEQSLGVREEVTVYTGPQKKNFVFDPDKYVGKGQWFIPGHEISSKDAKIEIEKSTKGVMFASASWSFSTEQLPQEERGDFFHIIRRYFKREQRGTETVLLPLEERSLVRTGDQIEVQLQIYSKHSAEYVHLFDPRPAGYEPEQLTSKYYYDLGLGRFEEVRDNGTNFFMESLPQGEYTLKYRLRANMTGTFRVGPATLQSMYAPEFSAYSKGHILQVKK